MMTRLWEAAQLQTSHKSRQLVSLVSMELGEVTHFVTPVYHVLQAIFAITIVIPAHPMERAHMVFRRQMQL
jgi:hypothetical protein